MGTRTKRLSHRASVGSLVDVRVDGGNELVVIPGGGALVTGESELVEIREFGRTDREGGDEDRPGHPDHPDYDTFDHILQATSHHEAMYAYYYLDADNKVSMHCAALPVFEPGPMGDFLGELFAMSQPGEEPNYLCF